MVSSARRTRYPWGRLRGDDAALLSNQLCESTGSSTILQSTGYFFCSSTVSIAGFDTLSVPHYKDQDLRMLISGMEDNDITSSCLLHSRIIDYESLEGRLSSSLASGICLCVLYRYSEFDPQRPFHLPPRPL